MLKWKTHKFSDIVGPDEDLTDLLAGMSGKNRVIKFITSPVTADLSIRVYRDAEQIVDFLCAHLPAITSMLPVEIPLAEGQLCKAGFFKLTGTETTPSITIGYEETG
ncbi:hypothetical protein ES703_62774 [subsurface metagenome]